MASADFTKIDKDKNGKVDKKEFIAAYPQAADNASKLADSYTPGQFITLQFSSFADVMKKFDITKDELDTRARAAKEQNRKYGVNIAEFDADNNNLVTVDELKAMHQRMFTLIPNAEDGISTRARNISAGGRMRSCNCRARFRTWQSWKKNSATWTRTTTASLPDRNTPRMKHRPR